MKRKLFYLALAFCVAALLSCAAFAQTPSAAQNSEWIRVVSDNDEFSVELPGAAVTYFYDREGYTYPRSPGGSEFQFAEMQMLTAGDGKTFMSVEIYKIRPAREAIDVLLARQGIAASKINDLPANFTGKQGEKTTVKAPRLGQKEVPVSFIARAIASKTHLYFVTVAARGARTAAFDRFLSSIRLGDNSSAGVKISSLKALGVGDVGYEENKSNKPPTEDESQDKTANPAPVLILARPHTSYTDAARQNRASGEIVLRATFDKTGRISKIGVVSGLPYGLNRNAFFAALRIKFLPQETNGAPETVTKKVEYSFSIR